MLKFFFKNYKKIFIFVYLLIATGLFFIFGPWQNGSAVSCQNNICKGSLQVGGDNITYYYTETLSPAGEFKIRFVTGAKNGYVMNMVTGFPSTPTVQILGSPFLANAVLDNNPQVTASNSIIMENDRTNGQGNIDYVLIVNLAELIDGQKVNIGLDFIQNGSNGHTDINFSVGSTAPANNIEEPSYCKDYPLNDPLWGDNDLDYYADCRDSDCNGIIGSPSDVDFCRFNKETPQVGEENNCYDRFDNDFDGDGNGGWDYNRETGLDCRDLDCDGRTGDVGGELCWYNNSNVEGEGEAKGYPASCQDGFNNDSDDGSGGFVSSSSYYNLNYLDCVDTNCWRMGSSVGSPCPARENFAAGWCLDGVDNDFDNGLNSLDKSNSTGRDCSDYDCSYLNVYSIDSTEVGNYAGGPGGKSYPCAFNEARDENGNIDAIRCFDGIDNDLDLYSWNGSSYVLNNDPASGIDCSDIDCLGVENPNNPGQICFPNEFEAGKYQVCGDNIDNDGDDPDSNPPNETPPAGIVGGRDCEDNRFADGSGGDCWQQFGNCGPCPSIENLTYNACADGRDNDLDGISDCADHSDCDGKIGKLEGAAFCRPVGGETGVLCFDGFNNDASGGIDCTEASCMGSARINPLGITESCGAESDTASCSDTFDNDGNGAADCLDQGCAGVGNCDSGNWQTSACRSFPDNETKDITGTIKISQAKNVHINNYHHIEISGSSSYTDLLIMIGSSTDTAIDYPYELSNNNCIFDLPPGFIFVEDPASNYHYGKFQNTNSVSPFTITIDCASPPIPQGPDNFLVEVVSNGSAGPENGSQSFTVENFEDTPPLLSKIEVGGEDDLKLVHVPYGGSIDLRGIPNDPDAGTGVTGICSCSLSNFSSLESPPSYQTSSGSDCRFTISDIKNDDFYDLTIKTADGADNTSVAGISDTLMIDTTPIVVSPITLDRKDKNGNDYADTPFISPFYKDDDKIVFGGVEFRTADNGSFPGNNCNLVIKNDSGEVYKGTAAKTGSGSIVGCSDIFNIPSLGLSGDGRYYISASVTDDDGYEITAPQQVFYVCGLDPAQYPDGHPCQLADFDQDGAVEGVRARADLYGGGTCSNDPAVTCGSDADCVGGSCLSSLVCDNCPNLKNSDQRDFNANGIGDLCEPKGFCILDSRPCINGGDCSSNLCSNGFCTIDGAACTVDGDCLVNYCSQSPGDCGNGGICLVDKQCGNNSACDNNSGGYCNGNPEKICFFDTNCNDECIEGTCKIQGSSCLVDADCEPTCENIDPDTGAGVCSNNGAPCTKTGDWRQECWVTCNNNIGVCSNNPAKTCLNNGDCPGGSCTDSGQICSNSGQNCIKDSDCPGGVCQSKWGACSIDGLACSGSTECAANECVNNACSLDGFPCSTNFDCVGQICGKNIGRCKEDKTGTKLCLADSDCTDGCNNNYGLCGNSNTFCALSGQCGSGGECQNSFGLCSGSGTICTNDIHCPAGEQCESISFPWLETKFSGIFTRGKAEAVKKPPASKYNATYCIKAGDKITNFKTPGGCEESFVAEPFNYPNVISQFQSAVGGIDLAGIEAGQYGEVQDIGGASDIPDILNGKVYRYKQSASNNQPLRINARQFINGSGTLSGAGLILVYGNLIVEGNISYGGGNVNNLEQLASLGIIVLDDPSPQSTAVEGNIIIDPGVTKIAGAFFAENNIDTGQSFQPLTVNGLMMAHKFFFQRFFASMERGSEQIIYDGRAQANPPPGMADLTKALPILQPF